MTTKEAVALLERYSNYDGMGIPNLAGCKEAMRVAVDALKEACPELVESEEAKRPNPPAINIPTWTPPCYYGGPCTNPQMDCINCPRKTTGGGFSTSSGTSTSKAEG